ncbi:hypothetical protein QLX08_000094 [Tetragonisca angustula]|uniref:Uncharacterized protein n=1 Tax=Tetragonisca angustula TaxID=166442 RepID=A0AAW1ALI0_9HYME
MATLTTKNSNFSVLSFEMKKKMEMERGKESSKVEGIGKLVSSAETKIQKDKYTMQETKWKQIKANQGSRMLFQLISYSRAQYTTIVSLNDWFEEF